MLVLPFDEAQGDIQFECHAELVEALVIAKPFNRGANDEIMYIRLTRLKAEAIS